MPITPLDGDDMTTSSRKEWARSRERQAPHLNFRWSLADMDKIKLLSTQGRSVDQIAFELDATTVEILQVCGRNGILLRGVPWEH